MEKPVITATQRLAVPGPSPEMEALRRTELRRYKALATGLLLMVLGLVLFVLLPKLEWLVAWPTGSQ